MLASEYLRAGTLTEKRERYGGERDGGLMRSAEREGGMVRNHVDLRRYFEYSQSGVEVVEDGLKEITFGEYLIENGVLDRFQLFRALQMQDRLPGVRLGECAAALGYVPIAKVERMFTAFAKLGTITVP